MAIFFVLRPHLNLPVALAEVYFGENCAAAEAVGKIQHVWQRINIWLGDEVQPLEVPSRPPQPILFGDHVQG
jgi:hypothetical protein